MRRSVNRNVYNAEGNVSATTSTTQRQWIDFRGDNYKSDNITVLLYDTDLFSSQDAVSQGQHMSVANKLMKLN